MKKSTCKIIILAMVVAFTIGIFGIFIKYRFDLKKAETKKDETVFIDPALIQGPPVLVPVAEEPMLAPVGFYEAKKVNSDVYAWIEIKDTDIQYPILQHESDDSYYLDHTIDRVAGYPGSIYTERANAKDFSDYNTVVYGHNMKNGTMFRHVHKFKEKEFFDSHEYITVYTETDMFIYRVYAVVVYSGRHILKKYNFDEAADRIAFIESLNTGESWNQFRKDMLIDENSKLITLATCIGGRPNNRLLLIGELVER